VGLLLERPAGSIFAVDVKKSESVNIHDFKGILALEELVQKDFIGGIVLYSGKEAVPFGKNLWAVPFHIPKNIFLFYLIDYKLFIVDGGEKL